MRLSGRPVSGLLEGLDVFVGQPDAAAVFSQHAAKTQVRFGMGVSILRQAAKCSSGTGPSSGGLHIFFRKRVRVAFLAPRSSA